MHKPERSKDHPQMFALRPIAARSLTVEPGGSYKVRIHRERPGQAVTSRWTQELLVLVLAERSGIRVSVTTVCRLLRQLGIRLNRPKPTVNCPWPRSRRVRRLREIQRLIDNLATGEVVLYLDEVDIHLNPKIGPEWTLAGKQKYVRTPGCNEKRYLAGALNPKTGKLTWVEGDRKNSLLFLDLLYKLVTETYRNARRVHLILDNYGIHDSQQVQLALKSAAASRIKLHFLPPYCPDHNRIERTWKDLHDIPSDIAGIKNGALAYAPSATTHSGLPRYLCSTRPS